MKTKSLLIAAMVMLSATITTFGKNNPSKASLSVVPVKGEQVFKIIYKNEKTGTVTVNILSPAGTVVFTETITSVEGFILPLNFSALPYGEYTVTVSDASGKKTEKLSYRSNTISSNMAPSPTSSYQVVDVSSL